jgi:hypothetical protein
MLRLEEAVAALLDSHQTADSGYLGDIRLVMLPVIVSQSTYPILPNTIELLSSLGAQPRIDFKFHW